MYECHIFRSSLFLYSFIDKSFLNKSTEVKQHFFLELIDRISISERVYEVILVVVVDFDLNFNDDAVIIDCINEDALKCLVQVILEFDHFNAIHVMDLSKRSLDLSDMRDLDGCSYHIGDLESTILWESFGSVLLIRFLNFLRDSGQI